MSLLKEVFGQITITEAIAKEFGHALPEWINVRNAKEGSQIALEPFLDQGEASAIALALEEDSPLLIIDESKGRKVAKELGIKYTGTLGIIGSAKIGGKIDAVKPIIDKIKGTNFRISEDLLESVLRQCGE